jgi:hypothetical protein
MKRLLVLLVAVAAAVVLAGVFLPSNAATVGTTSISRQSLDSDLSVISRSSEYSCFLAEERQLAGDKAAPLHGAGTTAATGAATVGGIYGTTFTDDWLDSMITNKVTASVVARDGLRVPSSDVALGRSILSRRITEVLDEYAQDSESQEAGCGGSGAAVLGSLPGWFVADQAVAEGDQAVLDARAAGTGLGGSALARYYAAHGASFDRYCVSVIVVKTETAATGAQKALAGGESFADEAASASITGDSAADGGQAGCGLIVGTFLASELASAPLDTVTAPFSGEGVWWLAMVTQRTAEPLSTVRGTVVTAIIEAGQTRADAQVSAALKATGLSVDPRYGEMSAKKVTLIAPPPVPPTSALLSVAAGTPSATAP